MEEMSEVSQAYESHVATTGEEFKPDDQDPKWVLTMVCGFLNMALLIGIVVLLTNTSMETAGGDDAASSSGQGPAGGGGSGNRRPSAHAVLPTLPTTDSGEVTSHKGSEAETTSVPNTAVEATTNATAANAETTTTTTQRTKKPFTKVTPIPPGLPRGWFICVTRTFGSTILKAPLTFPEDGVCDLIYYESVCATRLSGEFSMFGKHNITHQFNEGSGPHLLNTAQTYVKSRLGVAFCWEEKAKDILGQNKSLFELWLRFFADHNIHDTAVFNIRDKWRNQQDTRWVDYEPQTIRMVFDVLKFMKTFSSPNSASPVRYTALAVQVFSTEINDRIKDYLQTVHTPDAILTYGHLWALREKVVPVSGFKTACQLHPPHNYFDGKKRNYNHQNSSTMAEHVEYLLSFKKAGIDAHYSIMLTAGATREKMRFPDRRNPAIGNFAIYYPCLPDKLYSKKRDFVDTKKTVCEDPVFRKNIQFQEDAKSWVTFNKHWKVEESVAFDTEDSLRWKVCNTMANFVGEQVGVAAVDLDFDNMSSTCPGWESGPFERVNLIKNLNTFFQREFWDPTDVYFCFQVNSTLGTT